MGALSDIEVVEGGEWPHPEYQRRMIAAICAENPDGTPFYSDEELLQIAAQLERQFPGGAR